MSIADFSVRQPVLVNLVAISIMITGSVVLRDMHRESIPTMPTAWAFVQTSYPGASPEEMEQLVTIPLENAIANVANIRELRSTSRESLSSIFIQFEPSVEDVARAVIEVSNEVNGVSDLPEDANKPVVRQFKVDQSMIAVAVRGNVPPKVLRKVGNDLADSIERLSGVSTIYRNGVLDREIRIKVDPDKLSAYRIPLSSVADALAIRESNVSAGTMQSSSDARLVRGMTQVNTKEGVESIILRPDASGGSVRIRDIATVEDGLAESGLTGRVNGEHGVVLTVHKEEQADAIRISEKVYELVEEFENTMPEGVIVQIFGDASHEVRRSLNTLYANAAAGLLLVLGILWLFVGARNAAMAALGLPVALAGAIVVMQLMGITINTVSLLALILCLGIVVDDAIIIIENVYRHMEEGMPTRQAAVVGTKEVFWPVVSSTMTTWSAFLPLLLMTGTLGKFFSIIPKVVIASLAASLIEAMFILPSHMADFGKLRPPFDPDTKLMHFARRVEAVYEEWLKKALKHRYRVVLGCYALCAVLLMGTCTTKDVVLFTEGDPELIQVRIRMPTDARKEETDRVLHEVDRRLLALQNNDIEATVAVRGITQSKVGNEIGDHVGMVYAFIVPAEVRSSLRGGRELLGVMGTLFDDIVGPTSLEVVEVQPGPPRDLPVSVRLTGPSLDRLVDISERILGEVRSIPGTRNAATNFDFGKREIQIRVDEERAALNGVTPMLVTRWLRSAFGAAPIATTRDGDEEIDIVVELIESAQYDPSQIGRLALITPDGSDVRLADIATIQQGRGPAAIRRFQRARAVSVSSFVDEETNATAVNEELLKRVAPIQAANPDIGFEFGGQFKETQESLNSLKQAFLVAVLLIFTILATQFQSFSQPMVVMAAIPLSLIGVTVGFLLSSKPIGIIAIIGIVGLAGIVVNDSLVLVDFINTRRREGEALDSAIVDAGKLRLRPILLTSITTIAGLLPLAMAYEAAPFLAPMANVIVWGLAFATILTLIVIPCIYRINADAAIAVASRLSPVTNWARGSGSEAQTSPEAE